MPGFDPNEPRDAYGRWVESASTASKVATQRAASDRKVDLMKKYTPSKHLDEAQAAVQAKFIKDLNDNFLEREAQYLASDELSSPSHNTVSNDNAKELSPDYTASKESRGEFAPAVHEPASAFVKQVFADLLERPAVSGDVVFTAGGTGAGKTTGLATIKEYQDLADKADIVYDSNLAGYGSAKEKIEEALKSGRKADIIFVHRGIEAAYKEGVIPRMKRQGRVVPITEHVDRTIDAVHTIDRLQKDYAGSDRVTFRFIDNSLGTGNARKTTFDNISNKVYLYDREKIKRDLYDYTEQQFKSGQITEKQFKGLTTKTGR